jgi:AcrR family transcriptional regulator
VLDIRTLFNYDKRRTRASKDVEMTAERRRRLGTFPWAPPEEASATAREPLTRDQIVAVAIRLIDQEGLDAFSMRRLGRELGAGATSLYWHVKNKEQLVDLVLDELIGEVVADVAVVEGWRPQLTEVARAVRRVLLRHRRVAPLLGERPTIGPKSLDAAEFVMRTLLDAGFDERSASMASGALVNYAAGFAMFESKSPGGTGDSPEAREMAKAVLAYFASLPKDRYPSMARVARLRISEEDQFEYGLQRLLDGMEQDRDRPAAAPGDPGPGASDDGEGGEGNILLTR